MYIKFKPKARHVELYNDNGAIIRRFTVKANIITALLSGSGRDTNIAITMENGKTVVYKTNGQVIRS